jgi:squalene-hopene/tetraprenyl-beta-curcumene cyclase
MTGDRSAIDRTISTLAARLIERRTPSGHWEGHLASSALSTATAVIALTMHARARHGDHASFIARGAAWLAANQNADGGWGDTVISRSNLSTTVLCWSALSLTTASGVSAACTAVGPSERWLHARVGSLHPLALKKAIQDTYGVDQTFSAPILTVLALAGKLGPASDAWRLVPQLPFELAASPHQLLEWLRLPVVSYALPALVAIGHARHHHEPSPVFPLAKIRTALRPKTLALARGMQPASGGYLEATPLTSFVVMSLIEAGASEHPVVENGVRFLRASARDDGSWPIDTNLATWVTTMAIDALDAAGALERDDFEGVRQWLLGQQSREEHAFTHARSGGWAWTDRSGGVPDADDTAGALLAIATLAGAEGIDAARAGVDWLLDLQNRDGGIPTFCRGWGALPFDRSAPELTAHALQAWAQWHRVMDMRRQRRIAAGGHRATAYLRKCQREDGSWIPLWFGNEQMPDHTNPTYGTARVLEALGTPLTAQWVGKNGMRERAASWLVRAQNDDGGWGAGATPSTIEETGVALHALALNSQMWGVEASIARGTQWLVRATDEGQQTVAAPIGLYFARLWYYEELYPLIFALRGLSSARSGRKGVGD